MIRIEPLTPQVPFRAVQDVVRIEGTWGRVLELAGEVGALEDSIDDIGAKAGIHRAATHLYEACAAMRLALSKARR